MNGTLVLVIHIGSLSESSQIIMLNHVERVSTRRDGVVFHMASGQEVTVVGMSMQDAQSVLIRACGTE